ncbi:MAG: GtrA family protein [Candidatus Vogelbacteria bacterium]|nr:GtrA family protein [Candidatus Vogelbacteria bacterium]
MRAKDSLLREALRFSIAGAAGVVAYYAVLYALTEYLGVWYVVSALIGFILNTGLNFVLQKSWTFKNKDKRLLGHEIGLYSIMVLCFLVGNSLFLFLMVEYLHMWYVAAQVILTVVISILSFIFSRRIFKREENKE